MGAVPPPVSWTSIHGEVILGVGVLLSSARRHKIVVRRLVNGEAPEVPKWSLGIAVAIILAIVGCAMVGYLGIVG